MKKIEQWIQDEKEYQDKLELLSFYDQLSKEDKHKFMYFMQALKESMKKEHRIRCS